MLMAAMTLGVGFLLHFATSLGSWRLRLCLVLAYWAELAVVAGIYASHVRQIQVVRGSPEDGGPVSGA